MFKKQIMKELILFLVVKTFIAGDVHTQREIFVGTNIIFEEFKIVRPTAFDVDIDNYQIVYQNDAITYIDTFRGYRYVDTLSVKTKVSSHIWELKNNDYLLDKSILSSVETDSLLRCKIFNFLLSSNPQAQLISKDLQLDVKVKTCRICTGDAFTDSLFNTKLELVLSQETGDYIHPQLDQEFIFSVEKAIKLERGKIKHVRTTARKTTDIVLRNNSEQIKDFANTLINRENMEIVPKTVFFDR